MYKKLAWSSFCQTGDVESFLEYKKISELESTSDILENMKGDNISELNKSEGNSNKGNTI